MVPGQEVSHDMPLGAWGQGLSPGCPHFGWIPAPLSCSIHGQWAGPKHHRQTWGCCTHGRQCTPSTPCMSQQSPRCQSCSFFIPQARFCRKPD